MHFRFVRDCSAHIALISALLLVGCAESRTIAPSDRCAGLCANHDDGYFWAQHRSLRDKHLCQGYPVAFTQGCLDEIEDYREVHAYIDDKNHEAEE